MEIWKPIAGWENAYEVSTYGNIRRIETGRILKPARGTYLGVVLCYAKKKHFLRIHTIVAKTFMDRPSNTTEIDHKDRNKYNNHVDNLRWVTKAENRHNSRAHDRKIARQYYKQLRKDRANDTLRLVKQDIDSHKLPQWKIALKYNVSKSTISRWKNGNRRRTIFA
jgi:DNA-binding transcriptional regulator YiaG